MIMWFLLASVWCVLILLHIHSRRIDGVHERISLTTKMNGMRDPWREAEERESLAVTSKHHLPAEK